MIKPFLNAIRPKCNCFSKLSKVQTLFSGRYLLYTNTGLSVFTSVGGDLIQQNYQRIKNDETRTWSHERSTKMAIVGLIFGPTVHFWYLTLDKLLPGNSTRAVILKICLDQFVFSPFNIAVFLIVIGFIEQQGVELLKVEFKKTGVLMFMTDMVIWTPAQAVNFYFVPTRYRVLYDNTVSLLSGALYSYLRFEL
ncbi:hypothetical protein Btru_011879 [Bulinus truncatus]|nr:hypothetical protein Btru_011879 [Bulinus truncatus]